MDQGSAVLVANPRIARPAPMPRLRLLIEWESRRRAFFGNLADLLLRRRLPPIVLTSRPARFWDDVFVPAGSPWTSFLESVLWHVLVVILLVWGQSRIWEEPVKLFTRRNEVHRPITYYPPPQSFKAAESRAPRVRPRMKNVPVREPMRQMARHASPLPVTPQQKAALVTPPDIKAAAAPPNLADTHAAPPAIPFAETAGARRKTLAGPSAAVEPAPEVDQATGRRMQAPRSAAVPPAPEVGGAAAGRIVKAPGVGVGRVVAPPPTVAGGSARLGSLAGGRTEVVPPPPAVQGMGNSAAGRLSTLASAGKNVVPPPPSVQGTVGGRLGSINSAGSQVVPPPPSLQGSGGAGGAGAGSRLGALSASVVPPAPAVEGAEHGGADHTGGGGRLRSLAGDLSGGDPRVAPPASAASADGSGAGVASAGSLAGKAGNGALPPMEPLPATAADYQAGGADEANSSMEELPLGLLGLVFAAPGTSVFSNFEVFVAKRRMGKDQLQLIKLVYEFLPYQRRLSEYDLNNMPVRVIKLRVIPDPSCNESLGDVIHAHIDPTGPVPAAPKIPAALRSANMSAVLPCYRTSADDFQKAMAKGK